MTRSNRLFHYTTRESLYSILEDREINPDCGAIPISERSVVWCSYNPVWEEMANLCDINYDTGDLIILTKEQTHEQSGGLVRFEVLQDSAPYTWSDFVRLSGISPELVLSHEQEHRRLGINAETEWRVSFDPIRAESWLSIEVWNGYYWNPFNYTVYPEHYNNLH